MGTISVHMEGWLNLVDLIIILKELSLVLTVERTQHTLGED